MISCVEIQFNQGKKTLMQPYMNGLYESEIKLNAGENQYSVYVNNKKIKTNIIQGAIGQIVYIRCFPYGTRNVVFTNQINSYVFDSINHKEAFVSSAIFVGQLEDFSQKYFETKLKNWNLDSKYAEFDYLGGGIFKKTFLFKKPLDESLELEYKIVLNNSWEQAIGDKNGINRKINLAQNSKGLSIYVDSEEKTMWSSVLSADDNIDSLQEEIFLCGSFNDWNCCDDKFKFLRLSESIFALYTKIPEGNYKYSYYQNSSLANLQRQLCVNETTDVIFILDISQNKIIDSINFPKAVEVALQFRAFLSYKELDDYAYMGDDLGASYNKNGTKFKLWAPTASRVQLRLFTTGSDNENGACVLQTIDMDITSDDVWECYIKGDIKNRYYTYLVTIAGKCHETVDIYAKATGVNGERAMVVDLKATNPENWESDERKAVQKPTDAFIWEVGIKDFSFLKSSGVSEKNRGKYLAFTEKNTSLNNMGNKKTCLAYLKELGITHVHLLPCFDFASIDETSDDAEIYNWGYDPKNYNVPEGSYSSNPYDGNVRIKEFKQMVQSLHEEGIAVVMDVVYNHTFESENSYFNKTVPAYYYRHYGDVWANASGCGCETASERKMFRKYMIDSVKYWAEEYHIDGFRFDLMAIHDTECMNEIRKALDALPNGKNILMYGEPWSALPTSQENGISVCSKNNMNILNRRIASFNDNIRDAIVGKIHNHVESMGFIAGGHGNEDDIKSAILAQSTLLGSDRYRYWATYPSQVINFISCHDNLSLYDKLVLATKGGIAYENRYDDIVAMNKLAATIYICSQGIPFWQAGEEFARTKHGNANSYNSAASLNALDWSRIEEYSDLVDYYKGLIKIRKKYSILTSANNLSYTDICFSNTHQSNLIAFTIRSYDEKSPILAIAFNGNNCEKEVYFQTNKAYLLPKKWAALADAKAAGTDKLYEIYGNRCTLKPYSAVILVAE